MFIYAGFYLLRTLRAKQVDSNKPIYFSDEEAYPKYRTQKQQ